jgi:hypothetical protein
MSPSRPGNALVQSLLVFPLCLTVVAVSAIPSAVAMLGRDQPARGHVMSTSVNGSRSNQLPSEDGIAAEQYDEGFCANPDDLD